MSGTCPAERTRNSACGPQDRNGNMPGLARLSGCIRWASNSAALRHRNDCGQVVGSIQEIRVQFFNGGARPRPIDHEGESAL